MHMYAERQKVRERKRERQRETEMETENDKANVVKYKLANLATGCIRILFSIFIIFSKVKTISKF